MFNNEAVYPNASITLASSRYNSGGSSMSSGSVQGSTSNGPRRPGAGSVAQSRGPTWEELRKQARTLENDLDTKLITFSKVAASLKDTDDFSTSDRDPLMETSNKNENFESLSKELSGLLEQLSDTNEKMASCVSNNSGGAFNHTLQRHREILQDYSSDFNKTRQNIESMRQRQELLGNVNRDIQSFRQNGASLNRRSEMLNKEQEHARNADRLTDEIINMASATRDSLYQQRDTFKKMQGTLMDMTRKYPAINNLLVKISLRKRRDALIMAAVISACLIFLIWYAIR